jgi:RecA-family ATPase
MSGNSEMKQYELYSSVVVRNVDWLWYPYLPYGKLSIIQGDPGCGKSTLMMHLIACITSGKSLPNGTIIQPHNVIYQCSEDSIADTIRPRLEKAGADCSRVAYINEDLFGFSIDDEIVRNTIIKLKAKLLVIDPFQAYLGDADLSNAMSMRKVLRRLSMWASQYDCAIVLVGHLNKKSSSKELYRGLGSIDVAAAARSVLQIDTDEEDDEVRILRHVKSSLAPKGKDTFFKITNNSLIEWTEKEMPTEQSGNQSIEKVQILKTDKQTEIAERIKDLLADGPQNSKEMVEQLSLLGVSKRTIMSVKGILGIQSKRIDGTWFWCLPETGSDIDGQKI